MNREGIKRAFPQIGIAALLALIACNNDADHCGCGIGQGNHWNYHWNEYRDESSGTVSIDGQRSLDIPRSASLKTNWYDPQSTTMAIWLRNENVEERTDAGAPDLVDAANVDAGDADTVALDASDAHADADADADPPVSVDAQPPVEPSAPVIFVRLTHRPPIGTTDLGALGADATYCEHGSPYRQSGCLDIAPQINESLKGTITVTGVYAEATTEHGGGALANFHYALDVPASAGKLFTIHLEGDVSSYESGECM